MSTVLLGLATMFSSADKVGSKAGRFSIEGADPLGTAQVAKVGQPILPGVMPRPPLRSRNSRVRQVPRATRMNMLPWYNRRVQGMADDERVLYAHNCSFAPNDRLVSLVGGEVFVTSKRVIFVPNRFAAFVGGKPWEYPLSEVTATQPKSSARIKPLGDLPALTLLISQADDDRSRKRTVTMPTAEAVAELSNAIEQARGWL